MGLGSMLGGALGVAHTQLGGNLRMSEAILLDLAAKLGGEEPVGDFMDMRDPEYIRETVGAMKQFCDVYFRGEVEGLEHIPREGPALLVGNHSGGTLIADTFVFAAGFYEQLGPDRLFHQLAHDLVFRIPGLRALLSKWGTVPASPRNSQRALERGAAVLVYPGGDFDSYRPSWETAKVDFDGRKGFVRQALEHDAPIVPVVAIGGQETALFLGRGRRVAKALKLNDLARLKVLPPVLGPPFGLTVLDLPLRFPLPAKIKVRVLPPIDLRDELGSKPAAEDGYDLVLERMQRNLTDLAEERTLPVVG